MADFTPFASKMLSAGASEAAIHSFRRNYEALVAEETGLIPEPGISPMEALPELAQIHPSLAADEALSARCVVIKLNGGLGTGMGLQGPKSLLPVRDGLTFLDLIVRQVRSLHRHTGTRLLLMNSFSTSTATMEHLRRYQDEGLANPAAVELMQNRVPKIDAATLAPLDWPTDRSLEWCPPGHGDLYPALAGSGWLDRLLAEGIRYAFVSNSDNLGAVPDPTLLGYFAQSDAPFLMEVTRRTAADRKGGHLARRIEDGRLLLREVAQCPDEDLGAFQDIERHRYFNTNSLWLRLDLLKQHMDHCSGVLPLPMIRNRKTADPRNPDSPAVYQLETAMGAAIECFEGATAIEVPRSRFAPVKTTADLLALRSDAYEVTPEGQVRLHPSRKGQPPVVSLSAEYKLADSLDALGVPGLRDCTSLELQGLLHFPPDVVLSGTVSFTNADPHRKEVPPGTYRDRKILL